MDSGRKGKGDKTMKFEMIEKGWHYATVDGNINIKKSYRRECVLKTAFNCNNRYADVQHWTVYGLKENRIYSFHTLKEAQQFVEMTLKEA